MFIKRKKFIRISALFMALAILAGTMTCAFAISPTSNSSPPLQKQDVVLTGFSYNTDGTNIDNNYSYNITADVTLQDGTAYLNIKDKPDIFSEYDFSALTLKSDGDNIYSCFPSENVSITLEQLENRTLIDIVIGDRAFSFGGNRLNAVKAYAANLIAGNSLTSSEETNLGNTVQPNATAAGTVKTKFNDQLRLQAIWNPTRSNRLCLLVNTVGQRYLEKVQRVQIPDGKVPASYVIMSANPSGATSGTDFTSFLTYLVSTVTEISVWMPSFSSGTMSTINRNAFTFDLRMTTPWDNLNYSVANGKPSTNGILMYLFLDTNGVTPAPTGTLKVSTYVSLTGSFTYTLSF